MSRESRGISVESSYREKVDCGDGSEYWRGCLDRSACDVAGFRWGKWFLVQVEVARLMATLDERERCILCARLGIGEEGDPRTLQAIADEYGMSREGVRQVEGVALRKLKKSRATARLCAYLRGGGGKMSERSLTFARLGDPSGLSPSTVNAVTARMVRYAKALGADPETARDVAQRAWLSLLKRGGAQGVRDLYGYMLVTARHELAAVRKLVDNGQAGRTIASLDAMHEGGRLAACEGQGPQASAECRALLMALSKEIRALGELDRRALMTGAGLAARYQDLSLETGVSEVALRGRTARVRARLRAALSAWSDDQTVTHEEGDGRHAKIGQQIVSP